MHFKADHDRKMTSTCAIGFGHLYVHRLHKFLVVHYSRDFR